MYYADVTLRPNAGCLHDVDVLHFAKKCDRNYAVNVRVSSRRVFLRVFFSGSQSHSQCSVITISLRISLSSDVIMTSCRLVECRKLSHSIVAAAISQWRRRLSACVSAHGEHFEHILWCFHGSACYVNAENFWIRGFTVWLFCLSPKCNLSETFYQVWALRSWGGRYDIGRLAVVC